MSSTVSNTLPARDWVKQARLWLVLDEAAARPRGLVEACAMALQGGVDAVLCRLKSQVPGEVYSLAVQLRQLSAEYACPFVMSHHAALALHLKADGLQLGRSDISLADARQMAGQGMALGYSAHSVSEAAEAFDAGADYCFLGPVFATPSKAGMGEPLGTGMLAHAQTLPGPLVLIGGIDLANIGSVVAAGGTRVAAIRALLAADDITSACAQMKQALLPAG